MSKQVRAVVVLLCIALAAGISTAQKGGTGTLVIPTKIIPNPLPFHPAENITVSTEFGAKGPRPSPIVKDTSLELQVFRADASGDIAKNATPLVRKSKGSSMPNPGTKVAETFESFAVPLKAALHGKTRLIMRLVYRGYLKVRVPPGEGGKDNFRWDPFQKVIGAATFTMRCAKGIPADCTFQAD